MWILAQTLAFLGIATAPALPPAAPITPVTNEYWGIAVDDPYQYMEQVDDPLIRRWVEGQSAFTQAWLDHAADRAWILERVTAARRMETPRYTSIRRGGDRFFALKEVPSNDQPQLVAFEAVDELSGERIVVDPNRIDPGGGTSLDFFVPSRDGMLAAVSLSRDGTEDGTLFLFRVDDGVPLPDTIARVNSGTAGGSVAWNVDGSGLYYTRHPSPGERPAEDLGFYQQIWFHRLGDPVTEDLYVLGREFPKIAEIEMETSPDGGTILVAVANGDGGEYEWWLLDSRTPTGPGGNGERASGGPRAQRLARFEDGIVDGDFGADGTVYFLSHQEAPNGKILRLTSADDGIESAVTLIPEREASIQEFVVTPTHLFVAEMWGGPSWVRVYDLNGREVEILGSGENATYSDLVRHGDDVLLRRTSYLHPPEWGICGRSPRGYRSTALVARSSTSFHDCEVRTEFADAPDGTMIPIHLVVPKGTALDGSHPLLLNAYGAYGYSATPWFRADLRLWIDGGGIYAEAGVRGGGEFGEAWHRAGSLERKKTSMDDLAACARHLVQAGYTSPERLVLEGGSAGGLLVYGTMVHHPEVAAAVIAEMGYGDALRTELSPNGFFNTTEFGTVRVEEQFRAMAAYSPYHHIRDGVRYPAVLALTGLNDVRVEPWQSFKMVARLQASGSPGPVLLRVDPETGHAGTPKSTRDQELADIYTFLFSVLGMKVGPTGTGGTDPSGGR